MIAPKTWPWIVAGLLLLVGAYAKGCSDERAKILIESAAMKAKQDSALAYLRDSVAVANAERARIAYNARQSEASALEARRAFEAQRGNLVGLRHRSDSLAKLLAQTIPTESLPPIVVATIDALTSERDSLTGVVLRATHTIDAQTRAYADLQQLQRADSTKAELHARQRDAFQGQRDAVNRQLIAAQRGFGLKLKVGGGVVLAGVITALVLTR